MIFPQISLNGIIELESQLNKISAWWNLFSVDQKIYKIMLQININSMEQEKLSYLI